MNEIFFWGDLFEQQFFLVHTFLKQGELADHYSFIGLNYAGFNLQYLSNSKRLFSKNVSPTHYSQVSFDKKYQYAVLVFFTETSPYVTTATHSGEQISSPSSIKRNNLPQNYVHHLVLLTV